MNDRTSEDTSAWMDKQTRGNCIPLGILQIWRYNKLISETRKTPPCLNLRPTKSSDHIRLSLS